MSNLTDFFPSGGGGLTPKFQEFTASGTFTPSQALIDAGGYIEVFLVGGGQGGKNNQSGTVRYGGQGGEAQLVKMYLASVVACTVTIASGGSKSSIPGPGGNSFFGGAAAGGLDITSVGGYADGSGNGDKLRAMSSPSWGGFGHQSVFGFSGGNGINGYGAGGGTSGGAGAGMSTSNGSVKPNTGQGGVGGYDNSISSNGSSGYCLIKWYE